MSRSGWTQKNAVHLPPDTQVNWVWENLHLLYITKPIPALSKTFAPDSSTSRILHVFQDFEDLEYLRN